MRFWLLNFLKSLEAAIPPPPLCHHAITYAQFGSDDTGWQDKLALQINCDGVFHCFFLEPDDFEGKSTVDLIAEIAAGLKRPSLNAQTSGVSGRYLDGVNG
jgi:hypothetical protein